MDAVVSSSPALNHSSDKSSISSAIAIAALVGATALIVLAALGKLGSIGSRASIGGMTAGGSLASSAFLFLVISAVKNSHRLKKTNEQGVDLTQKIADLERRLSEIQSSLTNGRQPPQEERAIGQEAIVAPTDNIKLLERKLTDLEAASLALRGKVTQLEGELSRAPDADLRHNVLGIQSQLSELQRSLIDQSRPTQEAAIEQLEGGLSNLGKDTAGLRERVVSLQEQFLSIQSSLANRGHTIAEQTIGELKAEILELRITVDKLTLMIQPDRVSSANPGRGALQPIPSAGDTIAAQNLQELKSAVETLNNAIDAANTPDDLSWINSDKQKLGLAEAIEKYNLFLLRPYTSTNACPPYPDFSENFMPVTFFKDRGGQESFTAWLEQNFQSYSQYSTQLARQLTLCLLVTGHPSNRASWVIGMDGIVYMNPQAAERVQNDKWVSLYLTCPHQTHQILDQYLSKANNDLTEAHAKIVELRKRAAIVKRVRSNKNFTFNGRFALQNPLETWSQEQKLEVGFVIDWLNHLVEKEEKKGYYPFPPRHERFLRFETKEIAGFLSEKFRRQLPILEAKQLFVRATLLLSQEVIKEDEWQAGKEGRTDNLVFIF